MKAKEQYREAFLDLLANMRAATSAYEKFVGRHNRRGYRDALFETRYQDFLSALKRADEFMKEVFPEKKRKNVS